MLLKNLIKYYPKNYKAMNIQGLALNSKDVKKGFIFFAINGKKKNGEDFIPQAINNGASVIVCSKNCKFKSSRVLIIKKNNVKEYLSETASKFYKLKPKNIIAVTGTNGKTSVADFFYQIFKTNGISAASIGTLGVKSKNRLIKTNLTSPDTISLHKILQDMKKNKIDNVIIEASSHGLIQRRVNNLFLKAGIFTNFSQDHLDYHKTMKNYLKAKLILFSKLLPKKSFVISDSSINEFKYLKRISFKNNLKIIDIQKELDKLKKIKLPLIGSFQMKNLSMAILAAKICKLSDKKIYKSLKKIKNVKGRLEYVRKFKNNVKVYVDYAHTPEALKEALLSLKESFDSEISLVFGCGGERDQKKRSLMAKIAKVFCKKIYVTDDNPRKENPKKIRSEIIKHIKGSEYLDIGNRSEAIKKAIIRAEPNEVILVAGKGHEDTQDYGNKVISISDSKIIKQLKISQKTYSRKKLNLLSNAKLIKKLIKNKKNYMFDGLNIDSREVKKDNLFLAIKGKNNDGNKFIDIALKKGARFIATSKNNKKYKSKIIKIKNSLSFLNKFANLKRKNSRLKIIGITGSAGKTSLKNMLFGVLKNKQNTFASPRSFNNHYGVPLSLSNLNPHHRFGIFEIGMSKPGEINRLSKIVKPDIAVITNIAEAHIENFKDISEIAKAKGEIIKNINKSGTLIINRDDKFFDYLKKEADTNKIKVRSFGSSKNSDVRLLKVRERKKARSVSIKLDNKVLNFEINNINISNVLASIAVLRELNLNIDEKISLFKRLQPSKGRGKVYRIKRYKKKFNLIDESYNANPLSVKIAINTFKRIKKDKSKKYLLLGDMLELGKNSEKYHKDLSKLINTSDIDKVFVKGDKTLFTYKKLIKSKRGNIFQCNDDVDSILQNIITNNDYLMVKGSNATGLNQVCKTMIKGN